MTITRRGSERKVYHTAIKNFNDGKVILKVKLATSKTQKGGEAIINSKHFVKDHLGLDIIINQSV